ncbi:hypothetical protein D4R99_05360 [bacterium]|nr:MAG: hypothetical protein D4R99_05360 [bacterium]
MKQTKKTFLVAVISGFLIFSSALIFGDKTLAQGSQISVESSTGGSPVETAGQILSLLQELNAIQLDDAIFTDPMFVSLKDYHVDLSEEPKQRSNPFAVIGQDAVIPQTTGASTPAPITGTPTL